MNSERPLLDSSELEHLRLQAQHLLQQRFKGNSPHTGLHTSTQRGHGMELEDLRPYQWGDDVRHIAWRATARSGRTIAKVFREERLSRLLLAVEQHPGMAFATRGELKATMAARIAALITFSALAQQTEVGGIVSNQQIAYYNYSNQLDNALALLGKVITPPVTGSTHSSAEELLHKLLHLKQRGSSIYLISDFQHWDESVVGALSQLCEHHPVYALQIFDQGEQQLPDVGKLRLRSPYNNNETIIDSNNAALRQHYAQAMNEQQQTIENLFRRCGAHHYRIETDSQTDNIIAAIL